MPVTLAAGTVHTIVVLDDSSGLKVDAVTDAVGSQIMPKGAAAGFGGTAPHPLANPAPWPVVITAGALLTAAGFCPVAPPGITRLAPQAGPARTGDAPWLRAFHAIVPPLLAQFRPQILVSQHGADIVRLDPLARLQVSIDAQRAAHAAIHALAHDLAGGCCLLTEAGA